MTIVSEPPRAGNLMNRVVNIITKPAATWDVIAVEPATVQGLFTGYAMILAAIGPICSLIGTTLIGVPTPFGVIRTPIVGGVVSAILSYVLSLAMVFVVGLIIEALAPNFGAVKDRVQAMKVAVYSSTAGWLAGVFGLIPMLAVLSILALYGLVLLYMGLPRVMKAPRDKVVGYTAVIVVLMLVVGLVIGLVMFGVQRAFMPVTPMHITTSTTSITHY